MVPTIINIAIGDDPSDPVVGITDLLPHLAGDKMQKPAHKAIEGEALDVTLGSMPLEGDEKESVKANVLKILKENIQKRCCDPKKFLKILADFYDATDFGTFYQSQLLVYQNAVDLFLQNKDNLITGVSEFEKYFKTQVEGIYISVSPIIGQHNFGTSFNDGKNFYYEPHYMAGYFDLDLFIHELSHPQSKILVDEVVKNDEIMKLVSKYFTGEKKEIMIKQAYGTPEGYVNELINIANTMSILKNLTDESYTDLEIIKINWNSFRNLKKVILKF